MADSNPNPTEQNKIYQYLGQKLKIDTLVVKNSIISVLTIGFDFIYSFIFSILIIRNYSKSVYGSFEYIFGFFVLAQILTIPGLRVILFKSASQNLDGLYRRIYKFTLRISFLSLIFMGIAAIIYFFQQGSRNNDVVVGLLIAGFCCSSYYGLLIWGDFLKAKENFALFFKYELIIVLSRLGLLLYIYASGIESALKIGRASCRERV
mgnify:CR=1 FL=1